MRKIFISALSCAAAVLLSCGGGSSSGSNDTPDVDTSWTGLSGAPDAYTFGTDIAVDADGNSIITGTTDGALDGKSLTGDRDVFIIKYDASGTKRWTVLLGSAGVATRVNGITVDSKGDIYITGEANGILNSVALTGTTDAFIVKYNSSGTFQWTKMIGASGATTIGGDIRIDSKGNFYIAGFTTGSINGQTLSQSDDLFVAKYDKDFNAVWTKFLGRTPCDSSQCAMAVDPSGNSYVTGRENSAAPVTVSSKFARIDNPVIESSLIAKYDTDGNWKWTQIISDPSMSAVTTDIAVDASGDVCTTGYKIVRKMGVSSRNTGEKIKKVSLEADGCAFVVKHDSSGTQQWMKEFGQTGGKFSIRSKSIATGKNGLICITGGTSGGIDGQTLTGTEDAFVVRYDSSGNKLGTKLAGAAGDDIYTSGSGIVCDTNGRIYVVGSTEGDFGGEKITGTGDVFITTLFNNWF